MYRGFFKIITVIIEFFVFLLTHLFLFSYKYGYLNFLKFLNLILNKNENVNKIKLEYKSKTSEQLEILNKWLILNIHSPLPDKKQKMLLSEQTGLTPRQISQWFHYELKKIDELNQF